MTSPPAQDLTLLLESVAGGDRKAADELFSLVYTELRALAGVQMRQESKNQTLQSTALVHEAWLKLIGSQDSPAWECRGHFFNAAAQAMRRILIDAARRRQREKRGGQMERVEMQEADLIQKHDDDLIALDEALELLRREDETKAELVVLRYFGGCTNAQAAAQLEISTATAERYWAFARAWLLAKLDPD